MIHGRSNLTYSPASDGALDLWLDATDTTTLFDTGGAAITNGATIGRWESKAVARSFRQYGANARPTWSTTGWNGLAAARFNSQMLTATSSAGYAALSGITIMAAMFFVADVAGNGCGIGITEPHETGNADSSLVFVGLNHGVGGGGRRHQGDAFNGVGNTVMTIANNTPLLGTLQLNFTGKSGCQFFNGVEIALNVAFQTGGSGTTAAAPDPFGISLGAFAQETAAAMGVPCNGWIGEVLGWKSAMTPDDLVGAHDYLCLKWGAGLM